MVTRYELKETHVGTDGIVTEESWRSYGSSKGEPPFIKMYVKMVAALRSLPQETNSLITSLISRMSFANQLQKVNLTAEEIADICEECNISGWTYRQQMKRLIQIGVIAPKTKPTGKKMSYHGTFYINPEYFGKGDWDDIKQIRSYVYLDVIGGTIHTEVSSELPEPTIDAITAQEGEQQRLFGDFKGGWKWDLEGLAELEKRNKKMHLLEQEEQIRAKLERVKQPEPKLPEPVIDAVLEQVREADEAHRAESSSADQSEADSEFEILDDVSLKPKSFINGLGSTVVQAFGAEWKGKVLQFKNREQRDAFLRSRKK